MKKTARRLFCGAVASVVLLNSGFSVDAAGLKDIFDAEYYAEQYPDLKKAFGSDENALYQHFINYGIKEGRVMNPVIDVVKYREQYKDLQAAFGDDWDAYINHYFTYGVNEHRENGTDFDLLAYLNAYGDLQTAYGNDYLALAKHYEKAGIHENRVKASKAFTQMEEAKQNSAKNENGKGSGEAAGGNEQGDAKQEYDVRETDIHFGVWTLRHYDGNGREMYSFYYDENGEVLSGSAYVYDEAGRVIQWGECNSDGSFKYAREKYEYDNAGNEIRVWRLSDLDGNEGYAYDKYEYTYDSNGKMLTSKMYYSDGSAGDEIRYNYDSNGNLLTETLYNADGSSRLSAEYIYNNNVLAEKWEYYTSSGIECKSHEVYNERGDWTESYHYRDNELDNFSISEYAENGDRTTTTTRYWGGHSTVSTYKLTHTSEGETRENFDPNGNLTERKLISNDGTSVDISYKWELFEGSYYLQEQVTYYINCDGPARNVREEYNTKGDPVSHKTYIGKDIVNDYDASYTSTYEYAEDGSKVETRYDMDGNVREVINYNSEGERL